MLRLLASRLEVLVRGTPMSLWDWLLGGPNEAHYLRPHRDPRGLAPNCEMVSCLGCGAGNGTPCKCDPELGRKRKWFE